MSMQLSRCISQNVELYGVYNENEIKYTWCYLSKSLLKKSVVKQVKVHKKLSQLDADI